MVLPRSKFEKIFKLNGSTAFEEKILVGGARYKSYNYDEESGAGVVCHACGRTGRYWLSPLKTRGLYGGGWRTANDEQSLNLLLNVWRIGGMFEL